MTEPTTRAEPGPALADTPAAPPADWTDPAPERPVPFRQSFRQDVLAHVPFERWDRSALSWVLVTARIALTSPGFKVTLAYRLSHAVYYHGGPAGRVAAKVIGWFVHHLYFTAIAPSARLHGGLILPHPQGIVIGATVEVGPRAWIYQNVTMGGSSGKDGEPKVGADCRIHCGAVVCGPITVGNEVVISPLSLVQRNVAARSMAVGVPANVFPRFGKPKV